MKKLIIKKKSTARGDKMHVGNYDILVDGEPIDARHLKNIRIEGVAGEYPTVVLEYAPRQLEIDGLVVNISKEEAE